MGTRALLSSSILLALASCRSTTYRFYFEPSPNELLVQPDPAGPVLARVLMTVVEGRREGGQRSGYPEMHMRLLVENKTAGPLYVRPDRLLLVDSDLRAFGAPQIVPTGGFEIAQAATGIFDLYFPYPKGLELKAEALRGLNFRWTLEHPGGTAEVTATFARIAPVYVYEPRMYWSFGYAGYYGP